MLKFTEDGMWRSLEEWQNCFKVRVFHGEVKDCIHTWHIGSKSNRDVVTSLSFCLLKRIKLIV